MVFPDLIGNGECGSFFGLKCGLEMLVDVHIEWLILLNGWLIGFLVDWIFWLIGFFGCICSQSFTFVYAM